MRSPRLPAHREIALQHTTRTLSVHGGHGMTRCRRDPIANDPHRTFGLNVTGIVSGNRRN